MLIDLHTHTYEGSPCSNVGLEELVALEGRFVGGIVITDHDQLLDRIECEEYNRRFDFKIFPGVEISAEGVRTHILAFGLKKPVRPGLGFSRTIKYIHAQGGVAVAAHPFRFDDSVDIYRWEGIDAVEVLTPQCSSRQNFKAGLLADALGVPKVGGSDVHNRWMIGSFATSFERRVDEIEDLCNAIKEGDVQPVDLRSGGRSSIISDFTKFK